MLMAGEFAYEAPPRMSDDGCLVNCDILHGEDADAGGSDLPTSDLHPCTSGASLCDGLSSVQHGVR